MANAGRGMALVGGARMLGISMALVWVGVSVTASGESDTNRPSGPVDAAASEIVVTASRVPRSMQSEPRTMYRLDAEEMAVHAAPRTAPDALKGLPSTMVQKTGYGQFSPYLRGFTGFRTLCLVDGIRLNNAVFRDGPNQYWNTVDALSVQDYELVMGPSSVLYGSDAVGGVLNARPVEPPSENEPEWERKLYYRGATADRSTAARTQVRGRLNEQLGLVAGYSYKDFGDLRGGRDVGKQEHTGYDEQDYDARLDYRVENHRLTLGHQTVDQNDAWRTHKTIYGIDWKGLTVGDDWVHVFDQDRQLTYLRYRGEEWNDWADYVECTVSYQGQAEDLDRIKKDGAGVQQGFDVGTWGATAQLMSDSSVGDWVYGLDYSRDLVDSYSRTYLPDGSLKKIERQGPVADDAWYDMMGLYVEDNCRLLDGQLDVIPGVRYTLARADANQVTDPVSGDGVTLHEDWDAVAGSLRLLHPLTADRAHILYGGVSQGFRAPNLSDLTRFDTARSNEIETPTLDLDPEEFVAWEVGARSRLDRFVAQVAYYYTIIDEMIVRTPTGRTIDGSAEVTKKNSGDGYIQGVECSGTYQLATDWSCGVSASWMEGKVDAYPTSADVQERDYISRLMPVTTQLALRWRPPAGRYWAEILLDHAEKADKLSADDRRDTQRIPPGGTPGYVVGGLRAGMTVSTHLDLSLACENVTDEDYRIHGSGVNEPGRQFILAANATF